ncbi:helix-turn-helix domain-containing protein [Microbacterium sp. cf332]|uniref:helix-turn-helix domain-containing protein n=1 Tax=Microbacterium sp. cf332 TaxID=1761804 RepID=UPI00087F30F3|nr:helix-turn-helix domain-containing protein [Microbacterium sp. cf332]SDQ95590.1 Helix-turn-helix domain-containing protein [Microbacterium sp. cf332]
MRDLITGDESAGGRKPGPQRLDVISTRGVRLAHIELRRVLLGPGAVTLSPLREESALVVFPSDGGALMSRAPADEPARRLETGEAVYLSTRVAHMAWWEDEITLLVANVSARTEPAMVLPDTHLVEPTRRYLESLLDTDESVDAATQHSLACAAEHMIDSLFAEHTAREWVRSRVSMSLFSQASSMMAATRADPAVTPESIAAHLAVSMRHLQRAFQAHGTSPAGELRRLRLDLAVRILRADRDRGLTIAEVATRAGFSGLDAFRRALRTEKLPSPTRLRDTEPRVEEPRRNGWRLLGAPAVTTARAPQQS